MDQQRPLSIAELTARSKSTGYNAKRSFKNSLGLALDEIKAGQTANNGGDVERAFIHFSKAHTLLTEELPTHPRYSELESHSQEAVVWKGHEVEIWLNEIKALVGRRILDWKLQHMTTPSTPRSRVQSESGISHIHPKDPHSSAQPPPSPSLSAPAVSTSSTSSGKYRSGRGHRRTSSDVGKATPKGTTKTGSARNRSQSPTALTRLDNDPLSKPPPDDVSKPNNSVVESTRPLPKIIVRQPTTISQRPDRPTSLHPTEPSSGPASSISGGSPAVPALILTDISGGPSPSQLTADDSTGIVTPSDATAFPTLRDCDDFDKHSSPTPADKTRPRTLSENLPTPDRPPVNSQKEMRFEQPPQRPESCPPITTMETPANEQKKSTYPISPVAEVETGTSEFFTAPLAAQLVLMGEMDVSSDPEHPESIARLEEEAVSYLETGQFERATNILVDVLKLRSRIQGDSHLFTIQTMSNLSLGYEGQGKIDQAIEALLVALKNLERSHPAVNLRFRSSMQERVSALRKRQGEASRVMVVVRASNLKHGAKRNNSIDQIATRVRFDEDLPLHIDINTTPEAIMAHLTNRRCPNLTDMIDIARCSQVPVNRGGCGDIWQGMLIDGRSIAMKRIYQGERKINKRLAQELYAWSKADHQNVLELLGLAYYKDYLVMISPWMNYGSIHDYLEHYPDSNRLHMAIQIADGIAHLHRIGMVHGDLKARLIADQQNVFVSKDGVLKVGDFGLAVMLGERSVAFQPSSAGANSSAPGTVRWMAPELYRACIGVSLESDIYSLGMVSYTIYEIVSRRVPFSELHFLAVPAAVCIEKQVPTFPSEIYAMGHRGLLLWDLLCRCWDYNPRQRPRADQVLREMHKVASHW
ncbi:unnamed protein product [Rhizoctonia solani]|uniref:Protein kinase domain-containing protein n=1 Tax=Rhizoctonia solani TaxID=456999 RepID=A0A8H3AS26_9AGAM|nr:unnamed protein product [Rhizoctonia solani]